MYASAAQWLPSTATLTSIFFRYPCLKTFLVVVDPTLNNTAILFVLGMHVCVNECVCVFTCVSVYFPPLFLRQGLLPSLELAVFRLE